MISLTLKATCVLKLCYIRNAKISLNNVIENTYNKCNSSIFGKFDNASSYKVYNPNILAQ